MDSLGTIKELFISKENCENRLNENEVWLDPDGVVIDRFYGNNKNRSILLTSIESYNLAKQNNIDINYGQLGENILVDFNLDKLTIGSKFQIADVELEITQNCTICNNLSKVDKSLPNLLKDNRGVFAKAINSGLIKKGDNIKCI